MSIEIEDAPAPRATSVKAARLALPEMIVALPDVRELSGLIVSEVVPEEGKANVGNVIACVEVISMVVEACADEEQIIPEAIHITAKKRGEGREIDIQTCISHHKKQRQNFFLPRHPTMTPVFFAHKFMNCMGLAGTNRPTS